jgi:hypothetical protein
MSAGGVAIKQRRHFAREKLYRHRAAAALDNRKTAHTLAAVAKIEKAAAAAARHHGNQQLIGNGAATHSMAAARIGAKAARQTSAKSIWRQHHIELNASKRGKRRRIGGRKPAMSA